MIGTLILAIVSAVGVVLTTTQTVLAVLFRRRSRFFGSGLRGQAEPTRFPRAASRRPLVSILKPVCGLEDELRENLESFVDLHGIDYEVLLSVADPHDPALAVIDEVLRAHPRAPFRLVIGGDPRLERTNRKIARLVAAEPHARGEILFISDANVRVEADALAETIDAFTGRVGCVSNLFTGAGARSFGATIESLHLLSFVAPGAVLAAFAGQPCVVGKSMAVSRRALQAIGGFVRFAGVLAEDQAIGLAVREAGYDVQLSPRVVRNVVVQRTLKRAVDRQIRWNKIRYAFSKALYTSEFLANPLPFALLASLAGAPLGLVAAVLALRYVQVALLARAMRAPLSLVQLAAVPVLDLCQFGAQFVPYFSDRVTWRGYTARIGPQTRLLAVTERAA
ncbi:MAG: glycosyltransferase [Acidobacteria bacterium]|nr:glycosyltransferase [Acidobacteriota bacterium]MBV9477659.1 glycosyltransferase [Acidobacteriota bacterium]